MNMKRSIRICLLSVLLPLAVMTLYSPGQTRAQGHGNTSFGTDFWFGYMPDYTGPADYIYVYVCSGAANHVTVEEYGGANGGPSRKYVQDLPAGTTGTFEIDISSAETRITEKAAYRAVHVTATSPCAVYGFSNLYATSDGFLALPTPSLGKDYYSANYFDDWYFTSNEPLAGEFLIVAPYDYTNVIIKTTSDTRTDPSGLVIGHSANVPWTVTLMKGQTYLVQSPGRDKGNDITGSHITSDKPIGFLSGHQRCAIPNDDPNYTSKDLLIEMMPPVDKWGTQYFDMPMAGRTKCGDYIRCGQ
jgi:hypothetical protein